MTTNRETARLDLQALAERIEAEFALIKRELKEIKRLLTTRREGTQ